MGTHQQISQQAASFNLAAQLQEARIHSLCLQVLSQGCRPELWPQGGAGTLLQQGSALRNGSLCQAGHARLQAAFLEPLVQHIIQPNLRKTICISKRSLTQAVLRCQLALNMA